MSRADNGTGGSKVEAFDSREARWDDDRPNTVRTRTELDAAIEEGFASGVSPYTIEEIFEQTLERLKREGKLPSDRA